VIAIKLVPSHMLYIGFNMIITLICVWKGSLCKVTVQSSVRSELIFFCAQLKALSLLTVGFWECEEYQMSIRFAAQVKLGLSAVYNFLFSLHSEYQILSHSAHVLEIVPVPYQICRSNAIS
jgi:hypothetical protein